RRGDVVGRPGPLSNGAPREAVPVGRTARGRGARRPGQGGRIPSGAGPGEHHQSRQDRAGPDPGAQPCPRRPPRRHSPHRHVLLLHPRSAGPDHLAHLTARDQRSVPYRGTTVPCPVTPPIRARRLATCGGREVEVIAMRRLGVIAVLGALLGMAGGLMTASPALARGSNWQVFPAPPFTLPATYCGFDVGAAA